MPAWIWGQLKVQVWLFVPSSISSRPSVGYQSAAASITSKVASIFSEMELINLGQEIRAVKMLHPSRPLSHSSILSRIQSAALASSLTHPYHSASSPAASSLNKFRAASFFAPRLERCCPSIASSLPSHDHLTAG